VALGKEPVSGSAGLASDNPMYLTFPSSTNFLSSPICREFGFGT